MLNLADGRNDSGQMLTGTVVAMVIVGLIFAGALATLSFTFRLATAQPDNDEGIQARAELGELFASVDAVEECAAPTGGTDAAYLDTCFRRELVSGVALIEVPPSELLLAAPLYEFDDDNKPSTDLVDIGYGACWLTANSDPSIDTRQRRCLLLEGDSDEFECVNPPPTGPCLEVPSQTTGALVMVDNYGGGRLLVRSWDEESPDTCHARLNPVSPVRFPDHPDVPFLSPSGCFVLTAEPDRLIYTDVEWWCLRWRHQHTLRGIPAYSWRGGCPAPHDPDETWATPLGQLRVPKGATVMPANTVTGTLRDPPSKVLDLDRVVGVEIVVCVASSREERLLGVDHCSIDRMRFSIA